MKIQLPMASAGLRATAALLSASILAACAAPGASPSPQASDAPSTRSPVPSESEAFAVPPRPTDIPTDGSCHENRRCFGVLQPGSYQTEFLEPNFSFEMGEAGWVNDQASGGLLNLLPLDAPGDELMFLQRVAPRTADGGRVAGVGVSAAEIAEWFLTRDDLTVESVGPVSVGGLEGFALDLGLLPDAPATVEGCPAQPCALLLGGRDPAEMPSWEWDIAIWRAAAMRIWLLDAGDQVVGFEAMAWDGAQLDQHLARVQPIIDSIRFVAN